MHKLVLATSNRGKLAEMVDLLADLEVQIQTQSELAIRAPKETGLSFVENAILKARHAAQHSGLPAIGDDSGLEVDALNGAPGIYSARYAGDQASDRANLEKLLAALEAVPDAQRNARFRCLAVFLRHAEDPTPLIAQGTWEGRIARAPQGAYGFGYDPIFYLPELGQTAAELASELKNQLSHRSQALAQLKQSLARMLHPLAADELALQ